MSNPPYCCCSSTHSYLLLLLPHFYLFSSVISLTFSFYCQRLSFSFVPSETPPSLYLRSTHNKKHTMINPSTKSHIRNSNFFLCQARVNWVAVSPPWGEGVFSSRDCSPSTVTRRSSSDLCPYRPWRGTSTFETLR